MFRVVLGRGVNHSLFSGDGVRFAPSLSPYKQDYMDDSLARRCLPECPQRPSDREINTCSALCTTDGAPSPVASRSPVPPDINCPQSVAHTLKGANRNATFVQGIRKVATSLPPRLQPLLDPFFLSTTTLALTRGEIRVADSVT